MRKSNGVSASAKNTGYVSKLALPKSKLGLRKSKPESGKSKLESGVSKLAFPKSRLGFGKSKPESGKSRFGSAKPKLEFSGSKFRLTGTRDSFRMKKYFGGLQQTGDLRRYTNRATD